MTLQRVAIRDFRCVQSADLELDGRCNLITGENASGKTSLLEAIFFLGRGRSFRTARSEVLIRSGAEELVVSGRVRRDSHSRVVGIRLGSDGIEARVGGERVASLADLAAVLPVQAIDPEVHRLIEGGPNERRRYLEWGVFHVEPAFVDDWRRYQRALRQRNAALRTGQPTAVIRAWDADLVGAGEAVARRRCEYVDNLRPHVAGVAQRMLGQVVELALHRGWGADCPLGDALDQAWGRDQERRLTHVGPHRADLAIRLGGEPARDRVSRGQQKLVAASLLLGQLRSDAERGSTVAGLLVDDPAAELDADHLERFLREVLALPAQLFVTALDRHDPAIRGLPTGHTFHVEHGALRRLI